MAAVGLGANHPNQNKTNYRKEEEIMYEYTLRNLNTNEEIIKYGYSDGNNHENVFVRNGLNRSEWKILVIDYID